MATARRISHRLVIGRNPTEAATMPRSRTILTPANPEGPMGKKVVLVAGVLVATGAVAAISAPSLRGQRHGPLLDDLADGFGRVTQQVSQAVGASEEGAATSREERRSRRAGKRRDEARSDNSDVADSEDKPQR